MAPAVFAKLGSKFHGHAFRKFKNKLFFVICGICVVIAVIPLISILFEAVMRGAPQLSIQFIFADGNNGGIGPAIQGTLIIMGLTSLIGIPLGVLSGIYLSEFGQNKYASAMRTLNNIVTEFPSIIVGIVAYSIVVLYITRYNSALAGAAALSIIMIPIVARTTEESLKLVPNTIREASLAMGVHKWRTTLSVVLPSAKAGLITGTMLAVARIAGETAPLLLTIGGSSYFFGGLFQQMDALPLRIYRYAGQPDASVQAQAWGAALVLILIVLALNITVRLASRGRIRR
jgi:phosphate transport system permease protein